MKSKFFNLLVRLFFRMLTDDDDDEISRIMNMLSIGQPSALEKAQSLHQDKKYSSVFQAPPISKTSTNYKIKQLTNQFNSTFLDEIDELENVNFNIDDFPAEYRFLLKLPTINEYELRNHPVIFIILY